MTIDRSDGPLVKRRAALVYALLMTIVATFQAALVAGAPWGEYTQGGSQPGRLSRGRRGAAGVSLVIVLALALGVLASQGIGPLRHLRPHVLQRLGRVAVAYGVVAVPLNLMTPSAKERRVWGPFTIVSLVTLLLAQPYRPLPR